MYDTSRKANKQRQPSPASDHWANRSSRPTPVARGQSHVLGLILITGIVVLSTTFLVMVGTTTISHTADQVTIAQAERALEALDASASAIAFGEAKTTTIDLGLTGRQGSLDTKPDAGWLQIRTRHPTTPNQVITNTTLGAITYTQGDTTLAYQAGGLWRADGDATVVQSAPEFHYNDGTLILSLIAIQSDDAISNAVQVSRPQPAVREFPNASRGLTNKLKNLDAPVVEITVHSTYYAAWADFFRGETNGIVTVDHDNRTTTLLLPTLPGVTTLQSGIISTSGTGKFEVAGTGAYIDSYNSSAGSYAATKGPNGALIAAGDVEMSGDSEVRGDIRSGGNVTLAGEATVDGDVYWTQSYDPNTANVTGSNHTIKGVESLPPINWFVYHQVNQTQATNDNAATAIINASNYLTLNPGETGELDAGRYYVEELDVDRSTLVLNTTNGDITIGVRKWVRLTNKQGGDTSTIRVKGTGRVRVFIASRKDVTVSPTGLGNREVNFHVGKNASVEVPGENSSQLRIFGPSSFNATVTGSSSQPARAEGILYAPGGRSGIGYIWVKQGDVYGAVTAGEVTAGQYGAIHFDRATAGTGLRIGPGISDVEFLHVSRRAITIKAA